MPGKTGAEKGVAMSDDNADFHRLLHGSITRLRNVSDERMTGTELTSLQKRQLKACIFLQVLFWWCSKPRERC